MICRTYVSNNLSLSKFKYFNHFVLILLKLFLLFPILFNVHASIMHPSLVSLFNGISTFVGYTIPQSIALTIKPLGHHQCILQWKIDIICKLL